MGVTIVASAQYKDHDGNWKDIDEEIYNSSAKGGFLHNLPSLVEIKQIASDGFEYLSITLQQIEDIKWSEADMNDTPLFFKNILPKLRDMAKFYGGNDNIRIIFDYDY